MPISEVTRFTCQSLLIILRFFYMISFICSHFSLFLSISWANESKHWFFNSLLESEFVMHNFFCPKSQSKNGIKRVATCQQLVSLLSVDNQCNWDMKMSVFKSSQFQINFFVDDPFEHHQNDSEVKSNEEKWGEHINEWKEEDVLLTDHKQISFRVPPVMAVAIFWGRSYWNSLLWQTPVLAWTTSTPPAPP